MPLIAVGAENKVSATDMLGTVLKDVTFMEDGNIVATYKDAANGGTEWTKSPVNLAQYVVENDNQIKVFLNPAAIIAAVNNAGRAIDVQTVIQQAIQILYPMLVNGVPVAFANRGCFKRISEYRITVAFIENTGCSFVVRRRSGCYAGGIDEKRP